SPRRCGEVLPPCGSEPLALGTSSTSSRKRFTWRPPACGSEPLALGTSSTSSRKRLTWRPPACGSEPLAPEGVGRSSAPPPACGSEPLGNHRAGESGAASPGELTLREVDGRLERCQLAQALLVLC